MDPRTQTLFQLSKSDPVPDQRSDQAVALDRLTENQKKKLVFDMSQLLGEEIGCLLVYTCKTKNEKDLHNLL